MKSAAKSAMRIIINSVVCFVNRQILGYSGKESLGQRNGRCVDFDRVADLSCVAASHRDGDRDTTLATLLENPSVAFGQSFETQAETAKAIVVIRIGPGQVDDQIGMSEIEGRIQTVIKPQQVGIIGAGIGQFDIKVAGFLVERKIACTMHGKGEDAVVTGQNAGCAVALMDIAINDQHPPDTPLGLHRTGRNGGIVEDAKSLATIAECVMRAAGKIGGDAVGQRSPAGSKRCAG